MTEDEAIQKSIKWCIGELGTEEQPKGSNHTKYAALPGVQQMAALGSGLQDQAWCVTFQMAADEECFGAETAVKMERSAMHNVAAYVSGFVAGFQQHQTPKLGDWVVYSNFSHIGRVVSVNPLKFIDGNYSDKVSWHYGTADVVGYYTPDWYYATKEEADTSEDTEDSSSEEESASESFEVGDWVYCSATHDFSGMLTLNAIVRANGPWKIIYLNRDNGRAVLGTNMLGTNNIMTPVNVNTLTKYESISSEIPNNSAPEVTAFTSTATSNTTSTTSTATSYGVEGSMAAKIQQGNAPVILNNTATATHTYGGHRKNVEE